MDLISDNNDSHEFPFEYRTNVVCFTMTCAKIQVLIGRHADEGVQAVKKLRATEH